jgi:hypothetical protein
MYDLPGMPKGLLSRLPDDQPKSRTIALRIEQPEAVVRNHPQDAGGMQGALVALRMRLYSAVELEGLEGLRRSVRDEIAYIEETLAEFSDLELVELPDYTETKKQIGAQEC